MSADMNRQLAEKKAEVEQLRESLVRMGDEVKSLTEEVAVRSAEVENLSGEKVELQNQLNTVYYIVGAEKELRDAQIINKQGFIGRTLTVGRNSFASRGVVRTGDRREQGRRETDHHRSRAVLGVFENSDH